MVFNKFLRLSAFVFLPIFIYSYRFLHNQFPMAGEILGFIMLGGVPLLIGAVLFVFCIVYLWLEDWVWGITPAKPIPVIILLVAALVIARFAPVPWRPEQWHFAEHRAEYEAAVQLARQNPDQPLPFKGIGLSPSLLIVSFTVVFYPLNGYGEIIYTEDKENLDQIPLHCGGASGTGISGVFWAELDRNWYLCYRTLDL